MKKKVLMYGNERDYCHFVVNLEFDFEVHYNRFIQVIKHYVEEGSHDLIIMGISIPSDGLFSSEETNNDAKTGICFFEKFVKSTQTPIIFWSEDKMHKYLVGELELDNPNHKIGFLLKNSDRNHLLDYVQNFLNMPALV